MSQRNAIQKVRVCKTHGWKINLDTVQGHVELDTDRARKASEAESESLYNNEGEFDRLSQQGSINAQYKLIFACKNKLDQLKPHLAVRDKSAKDLEASKIAQMEASSDFQMWLDRYHAAVKENAKDNEKAEEHQKEIDSLVDKKEELSKEYQDKLAEAQRIKERYNKTKTSIAQKDRQLKEAKKQAASSKATVESAGSKLKQKKRASDDADKTLNDKRARHQQLLATLPSTLNAEEETLEQRSSVFRDGRPLHVEYSNFPIVSQDVENTAEATDDVSDITRE